MPCVYYHHGPQIGLGRLCTHFIVLFFYSLPIILFNAPIILIYANEVITVMPHPPRLVEGRV